MDYLDALTSTHLDLGITRTYKRRKKYRADPINLWIDDGGSFDVAWSLRALLNKVKSLPPRGSWHKHQIRGLSFIFIVMYLD